LILVQATHLDSSEVIAIRNECIDAHQLPASVITCLHQSVRSINRYDESPMLFHRDGSYSCAKRLRFFAVSAIFLKEAFDGFIR
jgi:hypothetical protein